MDLCEMYNHTVERELYTSWAGIKYIQLELEVDGDIITIPYVYTEFQNYAHQSWKLDDMTINFKSREGTLTCHKSMSYADCTT